MSGPLGRRIPPDFEHVEKYPLRAAMPTKPVPVTLGINWYQAFDDIEEKSGRWWIRKDNLGSVRGGHAICVKPDAYVDWSVWWTFYDQGNEGSCVGFGCSRMMTLLNRKRYAARTLYWAAQKVDEWDDTPPEEGTSVRAACDVLRAKGHWRLWAGHRSPVDPAEGLAANRWATSVDEVRAALQSPSHDRLDAVPLLNSWGRSYPHVVWLPYSVLERLLDEDGEATIVSDR